jgi:hypothetical protein
VCWCPAFRDVEKDCHVYARFFWRGAAGTSATRKSFNLWFFPWGKKSTPVLCWGDP